MIRKRFLVNGRPVAGSVLHAQYLKPANALLTEVKRRMQFGNLAQLTQRYITDDGATLTAMSRFGQDEIRIDVPLHQGGVVEPVPVKKEEVEAFNEYCEWLPDRFTYSAPVTAPGGTYDPVMGGSFIYLGIGSDGVGEPRYLKLLDRRTLVEKDTFTAGAFSGGAMTVDTKADLFSWSGYDSVDTGQTFIEQWRPNDASLSSFNAEAAYNHFVDPLNFGMHFGEAIISQTASSGSRLVLNAGYSDEAPPWGSHNVWFVTNPADNSVVLELVDPSWGKDQYLTTDAHTTPNGDTLFIHTPNSTERALGHSAAIHRYATGMNGFAEEYPLPDLVTQTQSGDNVNACVVVLNDSRTIYLRVRAQSQGVDYLYIWRGREWEPLVVDTSIVPMSTASVRGLLHDPVTDAVASLDGDGAGAWIFNGHDCFGAVIPPFYIAFKDHPVNTTVTSGQFHDAALLTGFISSANSTTVVGRIDIGKLKQFRVQARAN